jgi:hypothetical protein
MNRKNRLEIPDEPNLPSLNFIKNDALPDERKTFKMEKPTLCKFTERLLVKHSDIE